MILTKGNYMTMLTRIMMVSLLLSGTVYAQPGHCTSVHDGDTITVTLDQHRTKLRLSSIDAPELAQPNGVESRDFLARLVLNKDVQVEQHGQDRYHRTLADISIDGKNVNQALVAAGFAWWYRKYAADDTVLRDLEAKARAARRGLWADAGAEAPWEFRHPLGR